MTPLFVVSFSCRFFWFILRLLCCCSVLGGRSYGSRGFAQTQCLSPSCTVSAYYTTRWPSCSSPPWRSTLTRLHRPFLTLDILRLFVLVFFGSFAFGVIPGAWSPGVPPRRVSQSFLGLRDRRWVSLCLSHVCPRTVLGFCVGSCPSSSFSSCWKRRLRSCSSSRSSISCDVQRPIPSCSGTVFDVPCFSQVVCSLGHADDMPVVGNNRCLELDSVVLQSFRSCMTRLLRPFWPWTFSVFSCSCVFFVLSCLLLLRVHWSPGVTRSFLSCSTSSSTLFWFRVFFAQHRDSRLFGWCADTVTCLWFASGVHSCGLRLSRA